MNDESPVSGPNQVYARRVGQRLRAIRKQKSLSLQDVESVSDHEFKASVLGAYERGERIISVPRLQRLAQYYRVPVDQMLPAPGATGPEPTGPGANGEGRTGAAPAGPPLVNSAPEVTFDLTRLGDIDDPELGMVRRYLERIQVMRQDFNGRMLTIRGEDIQAIAGLFGTDPSGLIERLDAMELRFTH